jgi:Co/Zn/Cd efflux system component
MVVLYFLPMFVVIALVAARLARRGPSAPRPSRSQILIGLLAVVALGALAVWLAWAMGR